MLKPLASQAASTDRNSTIEHSNSEAPPLPVNEKVDRTTRNRIEDTSSKAPLYKGTLWKLNNDGNAEERGFRLQF